MSISKLILILLFSTSIYADSLTFGYQAIEMTHLSIANSSGNYSTLNYARDSTGIPSSNFLMTVLARIIKDSLTAQLPANSVVDSGSFTATDTLAPSGTSTVRMYKCLRAWVEAEATWTQYTTQEGGLNWTTAGGTSSGNDRNATEESNNSVSTTANTSYRFFISQATAASWASGQSNGVILLINAANRDVAWYSEEAGSNRPVFKIYYHIVPVTKTRLRNARGLVGMRQKNGVVHPR